MAAGVLMKLSSSYLNPPLSLNLLTVKELNVLSRRKIKKVYISARSMGLLVCTIMSSTVSGLVSDTPNYPTFIACNQCYGWKKQITRARAQAKKAGRKWISLNNWSHCNASALPMFQFHYKNITSCICTSSVGHPFRKPWIRKNHLWFLLFGHE